MIGFVQVDDLLAVPGFTPAVLNALRADIIFASDTGECEHGKPGSAGRAAAGLVAGRGKSAGRTAAHGQLS